MRKLAVQLASLLLCGALPGIAMSAETLRQAIASAIERFPEIHAAQYRRDVARAQLGQARAELFPSLSGSVGEGRERSRNASSRVLGQEVTLTRREAELSFTQLIFDGGAAGGQVRRFGARVEGAGFDVLDTVEDIAVRTGQAFVEVGRLREQLDIARNNIGVHEKTLSDVSVLAEAGRGRRADVTQAEARWALATSSAEQLAGQLAQAEDAFRHLTGRAPGWLAAPASFGAVLPARVEQAVTEALAKHPAVKSAEKDVEAAQHDRESARARLAIPRVTLEAGASRNRDIDGIAGPNHDQYAMLRLRYNFFRGFGDNARVRETEARINEAIATLARVRADTERDVRQAWDALNSERSRLPQLAHYARASADVSDAYRLQFQLGLRSLLDVLNAENERYNAMSTYIAARGSVAVQELRLLASQGRLVESLGLAAPGDAARAQDTYSPLAGRLPCAPGAAGCLTLRLDTDLPDRPGLDTPLDTRGR